jgi:hypothetical protein
VIRARALAVGVAASGLIVACSPSAPAPTTAGSPGATAAPGSVAPNDLDKALASVPQASRLQITANASPPGAKSGDVTTVSLIASDTSGVLKSLDASGKRTLADGLLNAAGTAWPNATVTLLLSDASDPSSQIIGSHAPGEANTIVVS